MGYVNEFDIVLAISAVEKILHENGYKMELGKGVSKGTGNSDKAVKKVLEKNKELTHGWNFKPVFQGESYHSLPVE